MWFTTRSLIPFRRSRRPPGQEGTSVLIAPASAATEVPERRQFPRRWGDPVEVFVRTESDAGEPERGWIKNRSAGGLCISVPRAVAEGTVLEVRFTLAPETVPWVRAEVKGCRPHTGRWILHCQYLGTPCPEAVLLFH